MEADSENKNQLKFPKGVPYILANVFFEKYSGRGTAGILLLFLNRKLKFDQNVATAIFHINESLAFILPILGAVIADSWLGIYKTIKWMTLVFSLGSLIISVCAIEFLNIPMILTFIGFSIVLIGSGCTKTNLNTFGANQYKLPEQSNQLKVYFSLQSFCYETGTVFGMFLVPILREKVKCFGSEDCYPLAYGVSGAVSILSFFVFLCGNRYYVKSPPCGNMLVKVSRCVANAITEKFKRQKTDPKYHWLDYAEEKYGVKLVAETKTVMNIFKLYLPLPIYWAVYMMQGSRWIFQATRMNGDIGFYTIPADQINTINPLFTIMTLPLCDYVLYPLLAKVKIDTLLQKMTIGGILGAIALSISAIVEIKIENNFISILWLVPQFLIFAISDNFMFISHLRFVFTEASENMKSCMMASVYLVMASGDLIVVIVSGFRMFNTQLSEFIFFSGLLYLAMIVFGVLASKYKPIDNNQRKIDENEIDLSERKSLMNSEKAN